MASKPNKKRPSPRSRRDKKQKAFMKSLKEIVVDMTAIEVHTIVVPRLSEHKFIAREAYRDIYNISRQYLEQQGVAESLSDRYLDLRRKLEREYTLILADPNSETVEIDELNTRLPPPILKDSEPETLKTKKLLRNHHFLRSLRKISEIKEALDNYNTELIVQEHGQHQTVNTDLIYARTTTNLDGDIVNLYSQEILNHPQKNLILQIHRDSLQASRKQWQGLLEFIFRLVPKKRSPPN